MKRKLAILLALAIPLLIAPRCWAQDPTTPAAKPLPADTTKPQPKPDTSPRVSGTSLDSLVDLYKDRVSEGGAPTLIIKPNEVKLSELNTRAFAGAFLGTSTMSPGYSNPGPAQPVPMDRIHALEEQVQALKKLNAGLEKALAECKPQS